MPGHYFDGLAFLANHPYDTAHHLLSYLLTTARRPRICDTNCLTDPGTGDTAIVLQFPDKQRPQAIRLTLGDWEEFIERVELSKRKAGF
jgi:hypothetical protein